MTTPHRTTRALLLASAAMMTGAGASRARRDAPERLANSRAAELADEPSHL